MIISSKDIEHRARNGKWPHKICDECMSAGCNACNGIGGIPLTEEELQALIKKTARINVIFGIIFAVAIIVAIVA